MISVPRTGEKIKSRFNGREFVITLVGERMIVLETETEATRFVTTIDNLRSFYDYAFNGDVSRGRTEPGDSKAVKGI